MGDRIRALKSRLREGAEKARRRADQLAERAGPVVSALTQTKPRAPIDVSQEPPVVARLVVEIRSDGTRTVARGALEDVVSGEQAMIRAEGSTPVQLASALAKNLFSLPVLAVQAARTLNGATKRGRGSAD